MEMETIVHPFGLLTLTSTERVKTIGLSVSKSRPKDLKKEGVLQLWYDHILLWELQNRLEEN